MKKATISTRLTDLRLIVRSVEVHSGAERAREESDFHALTLLSYF